MENKEKSYYDELSDKDKSLVSEYIKTFNQTRSYMKVFDHSNYDVAKTMASRKFTNDNLKIAIKEKVSEMLDDKDELTKRVIEEYKKLAFSDIRDVVDFDGNTVDFKNFNDVDTSSIKEITSRKEMAGAENTITMENINIKLHDKKAALDSLSKYLNLFVEKTEVKHTIGNIEEIKESLIKKLGG